MNENNPRQQKIRQKYSPQFKDLAVERSKKDGVPPPLVEKDLSIPESMLYCWRSQNKSSIENQLQYFKLFFFIRFLQ